MSRHPPLGSIEAGPPKNTNEHWRRLPVLDREFIHRQREAFQLAQARHHPIGGFVRDDQDTTKAVDHVIIFRRKGGGSVLKSIIIAAVMIWRTNILAEARPRHLLNFLR